MGRLEQLLKKVDCKYLIPLLLILFLGACLRFYQLEFRTGFDADAEEIALKASELIHGDPVLLGPRTSIGAFSIGPGFTYLWAFFSLIFSEKPIAGAYLSATLGLITLAAFYFAGKLLFSKKVGLILAFLVSLSAGIVFWDQNPWAPSLFYLSEIIVLTGAYLSTKKTYGLPIVAMGMALGFQSHFGIFLSALSVLVFWLIYKPKISRKYLVFSLAILFLAVLPNLIFGYTHNWVNILAFTKVFNDDVTFGADIFKLYNSLAYRNIEILYLGVSKILAGIGFAATMGFALWFLFKDLKNRPLIALIIISIFVPVLVFIPYKIHFSEYYLMMTLPPFVFLIGYFLGKLVKRSLFLVLFFMAIFAFLNLKTIIIHQRPISLGAKEEVIRFILDKAGRSDYGISLTTAAGYNFGFKYLLKYYKATPDIPPNKGEKRIFTIVIPSGYDDIKAIKDYGGIGVLWEGIE